MTNQPSSGFTLMEVLVALAILAGALVIVSSSWSGNFLRVRKSNLYNNAALLLESKMSELQAKYYGKTLEEIPEAEAGDFGSEFKQYRWTFTTQKFEMPDLSSIFIKQGEGDQMLLTIIKTTQDYISEAVLEGTLTVFVKGSSGKEVSFSVSTYFVDYEKELAVGGL
jgi:general secretion pathway protein I